MGKFEHIVKLSTGDIMSCEKKEINEKLLLYLDGSLPPEEYQELGQHLASCPHCSKELDELTEIIATITVTAKRMKETKAHPAPEDLVFFVDEPESLSEGKKKEIEAHLAICDDCHKEIQMIHEAPADFNGETPDVDALPSVMADAFMKEYGKDLAASSKASYGESEPSFWETLRAIFSPRIRYAVMAVACIIIVLFIGFSAGVFNGNPQAPQVASFQGYEEFSTEAIPENQKSDFYWYLVNKGIPAKMESGRIMVRKDDRDVASSMLALYQEDKPWYGEKPGNDGPDHNPDDFFYTLPGKAEVLVAGAGGSYPEEMPASIYEGQPVISAFSVVEDRESSIIFNNYAKNSAPGIIGADMEERENETLAMQQDFTNRIKEVLKKHPDEFITGVKVYVTLSFHREVSEKYRIQSVTVIIEHQGSMAEEAKERLKGEIRKCLGWKHDWDETYLFVDK